MQVKQLGKGKMIPFYIFCHFLTHITIGAFVISEEAIASLSLSLTRRALFRYGRLTFLLKVPTTFRI